MTFGQPFDPGTAVDRWEHNRPHWGQSGAIVFMTMRTHDSIPRDVLDRWDRQKREWLMQHAIETTEWWKGAELLSPELQLQFRREFQRTREMYLDTCQGACCLRNPEISSIVAKSLLHFDGHRYEMGDFIVMPNHVHLLAVFPDSATMKKQCTSWMKYTATQINSYLSQRGAFWQEEPFDHLVRNADQYDAIRKYIASNPEKARLHKGESFYYRRAD